jgi:hypothetical protein
MAARELEPARRDDAAIDVQETAHDRLDLATVSTHRCPMDLTGIADAEARGWLFETFRPPLDLLSEGLASQDAGLALAAARALAARAREGEDDPKALAACVPHALFTVPHDALATLVELAIGGLPIPIPAALPPDLPIELARRLRIAQLLDAPDRLALSDLSALDLAAVDALPVERALASGLWRRLADHERPALHDRAIELTRAGLERALLAPAEAEELLFAIARRSSDAVAARALKLAAAPWAEGRPCPALRAFARSEELALAAVRLAAARSDTGWLRRFATGEDDALSVRRAAVVALGALGTMEDRDLLLAMAEDDPVGLGAESIEALRGLKRRGLSVDDEQAARLVALALQYDATKLHVASEIVSSRADALLPAIDAQVARGASKARAASLLALFATQKSIARLSALAESADDPLLSRCAIRELGRLGERRAEPLVLARLEAEPEACLFALARIGGIATVQHLRARLTGAPPAWLGDALALLVRLDPDPALLVAAAEHGAISDALLDGLPAYAAAAHTSALAAVGAAPGHPLRISAIRALGRTGGPLAVDPLSQLLTDPDEAVRSAATVALIALGERLLAGTSLLPGLAGADAPGGTMVAEAALRRLRLRPSSTAETTLLLDALAGFQHPQLVRVVRPLLRRESPEIRKRAIACLGGAGPACAPWLLSSLGTPATSTEPLPVARQALIAVGNAAVPGLGGTVAAWLSHPTMNIKKTAAEALAKCPDRSVIPAVIAALRAQDQPGYRQLLEAALVALAGPYHRVLLLEALLAAGEARQRALLAEALAGAFSPAELAALVARREALPRDLLRHACAASASSTAGKVEELRAELGRRGATTSLPRAEEVSSDDPLRSGLSQAEAALAASALRRRLREAPFERAPSAALVASVRAVAESPAAGSAQLAPAEQRVLAALLPSFDLATRNDAIALLAEATDTVVLRRSLPFVRVEGELDPRHTPLLAAALRRAGPEAARSMLRHPSPSLRARATELLALTGEDALAFTSKTERPALLARWIAAGRDDRLLAALEGPDALSLADLCALVRESAGAAAAWALAERWIAERPAERTSMRVDLAFLGAIAVPSLRELAQGADQGELRRAALAALVERRAADPELLRQRLWDVHPAVRETAAKALALGGDRADRALVLQARLDGALRGAFTLPLDEQDAPTIRTAVEGARSEAAQRRLFAPVTALPLAAEIPLLLALYASSHPRVRAEARDLLRARPVERVLSHVASPLRAGDLAWLDVLGPEGAVPKVVADLARDAADPETWMRFFRGAAGSGVLYAAGLGPQIAAWAGADPSPPALSLVTRLSDWYGEGHADRLVRALAPALAGSRRDAVLEAVLEALRDQPAALVARVLASMAEPTDSAVIRALAEAEAASPGLLDALTPALRGAVKHALESALASAAPEQARRLMSYFADRADRPSDRDALVAMLERQLRSPSRRVRLHAHRLLRAHAPRERYLRASRLLLDDVDPTTLRLAIRVLAFAGDTESVGAIAPLLFHPHGAVARAAREGLLTMGEAAVPALRRVRAQARPDRRSAIDALLAVIEGRGRA